MGTGNPQQRGPGTHSDRRPVTHSGAGPENHSNGEQKLTAIGTWNLERVLGTHSDRDRKHTAARTGYIDVLQGIQSKLTQK